MMLFSEEKELSQEREKLRGRWKRTAPLILLMGALIVAAGAGLIQSSNQATEFGVVFVLLGVCVMLIGLQYCHNLYVHKENTITGLRSTEV
jgi:hypothetical protein